MPALEKNVGSYVVYIPVTFTKGSESFSTEVAYRYTIKGVELTAKVNDASRVYGDNNPAFSITYSGFINGDNESDITTKPTATTTKKQSTTEAVVPAWFNQNLNELEPTNTEQEEMDKVLDEMNKVLEELV